MDPILKVHPRPVVRVSVLKATPYVEYCNLTEKWGGIFVSTLNVVCEYLDFDCQYVEAAEPVISPSVNESHEGVLGHLLNGTADVGLTALGINYARATLFTMFDSFFIRSYSIVIHQDHLITVPDAQFMSTILKRMTTLPVWIGLFVILVTFMGLGALFDWTAAHIRNEKITLRPLAGLWFFKMLGTGLGVLGFEDFDPTRFVSWPASKATLLVTWCLYTLIVINVINSQLSTMFTLNKPNELPFRDIQELIDSDFVVYGTVTVISMMNVSVSKLHRQLASKMLQLPVVSPGFERYQYYLQVAKTARSVFFVNQEILLEMSDISCELVLAIDDVVHLQIAGLVLSKTSPLRESFERGYAQAKDAGMIQAGIKDYQRQIGITRHLKRTGCYRKEVDDKPGIRGQPLHIANFQFLLWIFVGGLCLSSIAFVREILSRYRRRKKGSTGTMQR